MTRNIDINAADFLNKKMRLFRELTPLQEKWISLEKNTLNIESVNEKVDWKIMNERAVKLLEEEMQLYKHYGEDIEKISKELDENNVKKIEPFMNESFIYVDVLDRTIIKLAKIINNLYRMSIDPEFWTAKEYLEEYKKYSGLVEEYQKEGTKMNNEMNKLEKVILIIKNEAF